MKVENNALIRVYNSDIKNGTFEIPNNIINIGMWAFECCTSLQYIVIPNSITNIGDCAFCDCTSLQSVTIPDSLKSIGICAFKHCTNLKDITIPNSVTSIGDSAFEYCTDLQDIVIPDSVTSIGNYSFAHCESLKSVTIPNSVTRIGYCTFYHCENLKNISIPNNVTSIGQCAFYGCKSLKSEEKIYKAFEPNLSCRYYHYEIGKWSDEIEDVVPCVRGYHYCTNLFDIFSYYHGEYEKDFIICECEVGDIVLKSENNSKCCTNKIKPIRKLERSEILNILNNPI